MWNADSRLLVKLWLKTPLRIATAAPSGQDVCAAMVEPVDPDAPGWMVELGGGTGPVTRALINHGIPPERLLVVENNAELHRLLQERFPRVTAVNGDAGSLDTILSAHGATPVHTVISTLPILTMPADLQRRILDSAFTAMDPAGRFLQITYMPGSPVPKRRLRQWGYRAEVARFIARNFPPATIWCYQRQGNPAG